LKLFVCGSRASGVELYSPGYPKLRYLEHFQEEAENMAFHGIVSCTTLRHTIIRCTTAAHCGHLARYKYNTTTTTTTIEEMCIFDKYQQYFEPKHYHPVISSMDTQYKASVICNEAYN